MYEIEKNVTIPPRGTSFGAGRPMKYPYRNLEISDSFFVSGMDKNAAGVLTSARKHGVKLTSRKQDGGIRFWRIA